MGIPDPDEGATGVEHARWERQGGDTNKSYAAFGIYRDAGPMRSLRSTAIVLYHVEGADEAEKRKKVTSSQIAQVSSWSTNNDWVARAEAWDAYLDEVSRVEQVEAVKTMRRQFATISGALRGEIVKGVQALQAGDRTLTVAEMTRLLPVLQSVESWARDVPESTREHRHTIEEFEAEREAARANVEARKEGLRLVEDG